MNIQKNSSSQIQRIRHVYFCLKIKKKKNIQSFSLVICFLIRTLCFIFSLPVSYYWCNFLFTTLSPRKSTNFAEIHICNTPVLALSLQKFELHEEVQSIARGIIYLSESDNTLLRSWNTSLQHQKVFIYFTIMREASLKKKQRQSIKGHVAIKQSIKGHVAINEVQHQNGMKQAARCKKISVFAMIPYT